MCLGWRGRPSRSIPPAPRRWWRCTWRVRALRSEDCSLALACGVTVLSTPAAFVDFGHQGLLAPDGRCKSFADAADGAGFAEGVGVVLVERLSDARRNGHRILGVVRGSAINQDGASNGLTAPNGPSQQRVIRQALAAAELAPGEVDAVEAHGTGTVLGDPIEAQALLATYGRERGESGPLWIGSIKSNIGHTHAAAGVAGVIKMIMAMREGLLPKTLHVDRPSRHVEWSAGAAELLSESRPWPSSGHPRRAGISSFGISGTNAHVIVEEAPAEAAAAPASPVSEPVLPAPLVSEPALPAPLSEPALPAPPVSEPALPPTPGGLAWVLSGRGSGGLEAQAARLQRFLADAPDLEAADVALALAARPCLEERAVVLGEHRDELLEGLAALAAGGSAGGPRGSVTGARTAFMFTGQGVQRVGMGRELHRAFPVFRESFDETCACLDGFLGRSLRLVVLGEGGSVEDDGGEAPPDGGALARPGLGAGEAPLDGTALAQPGLFALEVALYRLIEWWGVRPDFLIGHSVGELAAAHVAGVFSLEDACRLVAARGRLMGALPAGGAMAAIGASEEEVLESLAALDEWESRVALAAVNAPGSVVVSGDEDAVSELIGAWEGRGARTKRLRVSHAFHSPRMDGMLEEFAEALEGVSFGEPRIPLVSNLTGALASGEELRTAGYWVSHVRETVRFADGVRWLADEGVRSFLELGPDGALSAMAHECLEGDVLAVALLREGRLEAHTLLAGVAGAWVRGAGVDWGRVLGGPARPSAWPVGLPPYAFQRERYWLAPGRSVGDATAAGQERTVHPLLGAAVALADGEGCLFTGRLSLDTHPWLADHAVSGTALLAGTALLELALHAGGQLGCGCVRELVLEAPLALSEGDGVQVQLAVGEPDESRCRTVAIFSRVQSAAVDGELARAGWTRHAAGALAPEDRRAVDGVVAGELAGEWPPAGAVEVDVDRVYEALAAAGLEYGPVFHGLRAVWRRGEEAFAEVALTEQERARAESFGVHPALFDAALHALAGSALGERLGGGEGPLLPFAWSGVSLRAVGASALRVRLAPAGERGVAVTLADEAGGVVASVDSLALRALPAAAVGGGAGAHRQSLFAVEWAPLAAATEDAHDLKLVALGAAGEGEAPEAVWVSCAGGVEGLGEIPGAEAGAVGVEAPEDGMVGAAHGVARGVLALLQAWLADERYADSRLVLVTERAVAVGAEDVTGLACAPVWGLARSAQSEHPGRVVLVDVDGVEASGAALAAAVASGEPQVAVRGGELLAPRLARVAVEDVAGAGAGSAGDGVAGAGVGSAVDGAAGDLADAGTVLITGGTGVLGALVARHLVGARGVRSVVLASRRGREAPGAAELEAELVELGARVVIAACDVSDRDRLQRLLESVPEEHPLGIVVHAAGALDDGVIDSLSGERLDGVLAAKLDAAWHLHELTEGLDLRGFVCFSSAAGTFGNPGQGSYAAANAFLDALAAYRRARGLAGSSLAWGAWEQSAGMTGDLDEAARSRMGRLGVLTLTPREGLELLDAAERVDRALLLPMRLDLGRMRSLAASSGVVPALLRDLVRAPARRASRGGGGALARRLERLSEPERERAMLDLVRGEVAGVLGHASAESVPAGRAFTELGLDSLSAVELRNRLAESTGCTLPATLVFDYPTPAALAEYLLGELTDTRGVAVSVAAAGVAVDEPVAIVGMSCRYPGRTRPVSSPGELWELLVDGGDAVGPFPADRGWDLEGWYAADPDAARESGFLHDAGEFDASFFGISPREALAMDPQQRVLLEVSWEALEDAGIAPDSLRGSQTAVFAGLMYHDYTAGLRSLPVEVMGYLGTGNAGSVFSGRVAYAFGFEGPAVTIDTACSSSLVALHLACGALRGGECSMALAGGATVMGTPAAFVDFGRQGGLAPDGRCKSFADAADGVSWSEGVGVLALERLSDARRNGHEVLALVRGSAVNQDGASNGLTAPNGPSQQRVIRQALANARVSAGEVDAVEGHGTGTPLGDPIEAQALLATYGQAHDAQSPLLLGSIKSNIGHTQAAAGVAGVIKMIMALRHGLLPRTLHVDEPSKQVDWSAGEISLLTEATPWPRNGKPRRAAVSSFGISGTNAHVILEEPPTPESATAEGVVDGVLEAGVVPWVLSGRGAGSLRGQAERLGAFVGEGGEESGAGVVDVAFSLACRPVLERRAVVYGRDRGELLAGVGALAGGESGGAIGGVVEGVAAAGGSRIAFVFPGQGGQWAGMAVGLLDESPVFASCMRECGEALGSHVEWELEGVLRGEAGAPGLERVDVVQPVLFAVMVSLARLWGACGVRPDAVVGHSQGEIAAACVAGGLTLEDAARVVVCRSRALVSLVGLGGMVSVGLGVEELRSRVEGVGEGLSVAAVNGPGSVVVSGGIEALDELVGWCEREGVRARRIPVGYAAHSPQVEGIREELLDGCAGIAPWSGGVPFVSSVTGGVLDMAELDAGYWYRNLRETVQFEGAARALLGEGYGTFVEASPHPVLAIGLQETVDALAGEEGAAGSGVSEAGVGEAGVVGSLRRGEGGAARFVVSLGEAWVRGAEVDWRGLLGGRGARRVGLPSYAFQRERYWLEMDGPGVGDVAAVGQVRSEHPLLGAAVAVAGGEGLLFTGRLSLGVDPWLGDCVVMGRVLVAGAVFVELALYVGGEVGCGVVRELVLEAPLVLGEEGVQLQVVVGEPDGDGCRSVGVFSRLEGAGGEDSWFAQEWTRHAGGVLAPGVGVGLADPVGVEGRVGAGESLVGGVWPPVGGEVVDGEDLYDVLAGVGCEYGPAFQCLRRAWRGEEGVFAEVELSEDERERAGRFGLHPGLLDGVCHAMFGLLGGDVGGERGLRLPFAWEGVRLYATGAVSLRARLCEGEGGGASVVVVDEGGELVASVDSVSGREVAGGELAGGVGAHRDSLFHVEWVPVALEGVGSDTAVVVEDFGVAARAGVGVVGGLPAQAREVLRGALERVQEWLADEGSLGSRLVFLTEGAVAAGAGEGVSDLAGAPLWGLVRSAQSEHPGRLVLVDWDGEDASRAALDAALGSGEPQIALREGAAFVPRLARAGGVGKASAGEAGAEIDAEVAGVGEAGAEIDAEVAGVGEAGAEVAGAGEAGVGETDAHVIDERGTVLVTGGTGGLGAVVARHLVSEHGVRSLLLVSRRGREAEGAAELEDELAGLGAQVRVAACDVADREQLRELIASVPEEYPLGAVVHTAGVFENAMIDSLTPEQVDRVLTPKLDAALHLHELTEHLDLRAFVMFSSMASTFGGPGQGNYAAGNAFLDALAAHRRARGLAATSMAWGLWREVGMGRFLGEVDMRRMAGTAGFGSFGPGEGMALFDAALADGGALLIQAPLDAGVLRAEARAGALPRLLSGLVRVPLRQASEGGVVRASLAARLAGIPAGEHESAVLEIVRAQVATVLGHRFPENVDTSRAFRDLGFDSLSAVELRNRLVVATGLALPATLIFDYPNPHALARHLRTVALPDAGSDPDLDPEAAVREAIASIPVARLREAGLMDVLLALSDSNGEGQALVERDQTDAIDTMDLESLVQRTLESTHSQWGDSQ